MTFSQPNIVFVTIDSLRPDFLGCYGAADVCTPNLDALASSGFLFEQAITAGSWTQAAFPALMTSTYASMYGGCLGTLSPFRPCPVEELSKKGYSTAGFSTNPLIGSSYGYDRGFQQFKDLVPDESETWLRRVKGGQRLLRNRALQGLMQKLSRGLRPSRCYVSAADTVQEVQEWLHSMRPPFFIWVHLMDTHWPYHIEESLEDAKSIAQAWCDLAALHQFSTSRSQDLGSDLKNHLVQLYRLAVEYTDSQIGRLLDTLDRIQLIDKTVVIVVSDHGEEFAEHGHWGHVEINLFDEVLRVPLIIRLPGVEGAKLVPQQVSTLHVMPTILDIGGASPPAGMLGRSLLAMLEGNTDKIDLPEAICERWRENSHIVALRNESYKYIWHKECPAEPELYDLKTDPGEKSNLLGSPSDLESTFKEKVDYHLEEVARTNTSSPIAPPKINREMTDRLRALGYVD